MPRVAIAQQLLSKLTKAFDGGMVAHGYFNLITLLSGRTSRAMYACASASTRVRPEPLGWAVFRVVETAERCIGPQ